MSFGARLRQMRRECGCTQRELALRIGVKHNTVSNWEKDKSSPDPAMIAALCAALSVPAGSLFAETAGAPPELAEDERAVLAKWRSLDAQARGAVTALLDFYCAAVVEREPEVPDALRFPMTGVVEVHPGQAGVIEARLSTQSAAAGGGAYLDTDAFETMLVADNEITRRADFFVPVAGDSMEPQYSDGDILAVMDAPVARGEVGVFVLDGLGYVKVRGDGALLSYNEAYGPIPMHDGIRCSGKVIGVLDPGWIMS